jgi:WD40 repeat protein
LLTAHWHLLGWLPASAPSAPAALTPGDPAAAAAAVSLLLLQGHSEDVLDLSWSAGGFLLTASLDKSVRLWHLSQPGCLRKYWHSDIVTGVQFHPGDAQRFVSGREKWSQPPAANTAAAMYD